MTERGNLKISYSTFIQNHTHKQLFTNTQIFQINSNIGEKCMQLNFSKII